MKVKELISICKEKGFYRYDFGHDDYVGHVFIFVDHVGLEIVELPQRWGLYNDFQKEGSKLEKVFETEEELCDYIMKNYIQ